MCVYKLLIPILIGFPVIAWLNSQITQREMQIPLFLLALFMHSTLLRPPSIVELLMMANNQAKPFFCSLGPSMDVGGRSWFYIYSLCWSNTELVLVPAKHNGYINYIRTSRRMTRDGIEMIEGKK